VVAVDTFLTTLYVMIDDFCNASLAAEAYPGPHAALSRREVLTLAIVGQWQGFGSERGFYRHAQHHLRPAFPGLPTRAPLNRQRRHHQRALVACFPHLGPLLAAQPCREEALDSSGVPTRDAKRRGAGWLPGLADIGWSHRPGWYEGFHLILAVNPVGAITGFGVGPASTKDQRLADTLFALRRRPHPALHGAGAPAQGPSVVATALWGRRDLPAATQQYAAAAQAAAALAGRDTPESRDRVRQALAYLQAGPGTPTCARRLPGTLGRQGYAA
jgi:hypothetical protein